MTRRNPRHGRKLPTAAPPSAQAKDKVLESIEALAETMHEDCAYWLALYAQNNPHPPGLVLMLLPEGHAAQPLQRESVLDMARALGLEAALAALGPLAPVLVLGRGRALLMGSAVGAITSPSPIFSPGGVA